MKISTAKFESGQSKERDSELNFSELSLIGEAFVLIEDEIPNYDKKANILLFVEEDRPWYGNFVQIKLRRSLTTRNIKLGTELIFEEIQPIKPGAWKGNIASTEEQEIILKKGAVYNLAYTDIDGQDEGALRIDLTS